MLTVYRGLNCKEEQKEIENGVVKGQWFSTDIDDAINFAMKTKGNIIKCEIELHKEQEDVYLTSYEETKEHKGWGVKKTDGSFSFGDWYYLDEQYLNNVTLKEIYSYEEALSFEEN